MNLTTEEKVKKLLNEMTLEEKISQLSCTMSITFLKNGRVNEAMLKESIGKGIGRVTQFATGFLEGVETAAEGHNAIQRYVLENSRIKIPILIQNETATGLVAAKATTFPVPIAIASTWEPNLTRRMGKIICEEAKAIGIRVGLSPVADVARDARWGRVGETFGEDPTLVSRFCVEKVKGMQGDRYGDNLICCGKHFMGYAVSDNGINGSVVNLGFKELVEVHGTPFSAMIQNADLESIMVTYSAIDGQPMSINQKYLRGILRNDMEFKGSLLCDANSIPMSKFYFGLGENMNDIAVRALKAGLDADTPVTTTFQGLIEEVQSGQLEESYVDEAVSRVLTEKFNLGLFDNPFVDPEETKRIYARKDGDLLAKEMAEKEIVLLKNDGILPLQKKNKKIALIGPFANRLSTLFGGYAYPSFVEMLLNTYYGEQSHMEGISTYLSKYLDIDDVKEKLHIKEGQCYETTIENYLRETYDIKTLFETMKSTFSQNDVTYSVGVSNPQDFEQDKRNALESAKDADVIVLSIGEVTGFGKDATSGEGINNPDLNLPYLQEELLKSLVELGKPVILLLFNGRPLTINYAAQHCAAIVEVWYPGPYGAQAITDVLSGKINPSGKLPITFPKDSGQCPIYYGHKTGSGYRPMDLADENKDAVMLMNNSPLYHFGHGLSYTQFTYSNLQIDASVEIGCSFDVRFNVKNTGQVDGDEIVQLYIHTDGASTIRPISELKAFQRVPLKKGQEKELQFTLDTRQFGYYNEYDKFVVEPCLQNIMIGSSSWDIRLHDSIQFTGKEKEILHDRVYDFICEIKN